MTRRMASGSCAVVLLLSVAWTTASTAERPSRHPITPSAAGSIAGPIQDGLDWLSANQNANGSWGGTFPIIETATSVESVAVIDPFVAALEPAASWLAAEDSPNNELLARQILALAHVEAHENTASVLAQQLLTLRNPAEPNPAYPNWPEGGWGIAPGFETDSLTTALAMLALSGAGFNGGFEVADGAVEGGALNAHEWEIPSDATKARIVITVAGSEIRLCMTEGAPPPACSSYFPLLGGPWEVVFPDSGLPFTAGTNYVVVQSPDPPASPATYTFTASYETPTFDTRMLAEPLAYLREAQNPDGGWGIQRGQPTDFYTTLHVLLAMERFSRYDLATEIADAVAYVKTQQLGDGSFGLEGSGVPYVTALASLALMRSENCIFSVETDDAIGALLLQQDVDGSWNQEPYDTSLAMLALWEYGDDIDGDGIRGDGDCSGTVGDNPCVDGTVGCDDNCPSTPNPSQLNNDGDQRGDACDCDSGSSLVWSDPADVVLRVAYFPDLPITELSWDDTADPGGTEPAVYDVLQSLDPADFTTSAICLESDDSDTLAIDGTLSEDPLFYLVRVQNDCPGDGTLGNDSSGAERVGTSCP